MPLDRGDHAMNDKPRGGIRTRCHACGGGGGIAVERMEISLHGGDRMEGSAYWKPPGVETRKCQVCGGSGWLTGIVPPV